jgi:hypothetical protein
VRRPSVFKELHGSGVQIVISVDDFDPPCFFEFPDNHTLPPDLLYREQDFERRYVFHKLRVFTGSVLSGGFPRKQQAESR